MAEKHLKRNDVVVPIGGYSNTSQELRKVTTALSNLVTRITEEGEKNRWANHKTINRKIVLSPSAPYARNSGFKILETVNTIDYVVGKFLDRSRVDMLCENPSIEVIIK